MKKALVLSEDGASLQEVDLANNFITLAEPMATFTAFKIGDLGKAYIVTADDLTIPIIDGITLESGGIDSIVQYACVRNNIYHTIFDFTEAKFYWLTSTGVISTVRPTNTRYQVLVGRCLPNSSNFIFDPQLPIKLL
jgi:hypothetical protein